MARFGRFWVVFCPSPRQKNADFSAGSGDLVHVEDVLLGSDYVNSTCNGWIRAIDWSRSTVNGSVSCATVDRSRCAIGEHSRNRCNRSKFKWMTRRSAGSLRPICTWASASLLLMPPFFFFFLASDIAHMCTVSSKYKLHGINSMVKSL